MTGVQTCALPIFDVRFHQLEEGTGARVRMRRVSEQTGDEVLWARPAGDAETEAQVLLSAIMARGSINLQWWEEYVPAAVS